MKQRSDSLAVAAQIKLEEKSDYIIQVQEENKTETKRLNDSIVFTKNSIINLQQETVNQITGGNSFPY